MIGKTGGVVSLMGPSSQLVEVEACWIDYRPEPLETSNGQRLLINAEGETTLSTNPRRVTFTPAKVDPWNRQDFNFPAQNKKTKGKLFSSFFFHHCKALWLIWIQSITGPKESFFFSLFLCNPFSRQLCAQAQGFGSEKVKSRECFLFSSSFELFEEKRKKTFFTRRCRWVLNSNGAPGA